MMKNFSDYVVYIDESGDHNLSSIDEKYPVFVLVFCVFHKKYYSEKIVPAIQQFKFRHFGHDCIILHENEIQNQKNDFSFLSQKDIFNHFIGDLSNVLDEGQFILISCVVENIKVKQNDNHDSSDSNDVGDIHNIHDNDEDDHNNEHNDSSDNFNKHEKISNIDKSYNNDESGNNNIKINHVYYCYYYSLILQYTIIDLVYTEFFSPAIVSSQ